MVLVAFHGGGGTPANMKGKSGLDEIADREEFITIYPEALGGGGTPTWNAGLGCCGYARDADLDDVGFFVDILEDMSERHPINRNRIWVTGHSNGAMLAHRIAAEVPERIAGAVGVGGALQVPHIVPRSAVPILHIHSEDDPRAFYLGGDRGANTHANVESMLTRWATTNSCGPAAVEVELRTDSQSGHQAKHLRWNCQGAPLEHWRLTGPGHAWPGNPVPAWRVPILGPGTEVIQAAEEVWDFIKRQGG